MKKGEYLKSVISGMLKENTGVHFLDSGGAYGRNWERNQLREFENEPACVVSIDGNDDGAFDGVNVTYNLYHFLTNFLDTDTQTGVFNRSFQVFSDKPENESIHWPELIDKWIEKNGFTEVHGFNSYNGESILSQVIQGWVFEHDGENYIVLQVHGGCDVRGGYTAPRIFRVLDLDYFILAQVDVYASCHGMKFDPRQLCLPGIKLDPFCRNNWTSDDAGYRWYFDGCSTNEKPLEDTARYDPETEKLICCECGGEIQFSVMESF